jgi:hypothetical protein
LYFSAQFAEKFSRVYRSPDPQWERVPPSCTLPSTSNFWPLLFKPFREEEGGDRMGEDGTRGEARRGKKGREGRAFVALG